MHQDSRLTQQITILEMLIQIKEEQINHMIDEIQKIENTLYIREHTPPNHTTR